jgi:hypothetical protein
MSDRTINIALKVWRQPAADQPGKFVAYRMEKVSTDS